MYEITLNALKTANNERLWFNTSVKLGKLYLDLGDHLRLQKSIQELHKSCQTTDGKDDASKGTYLLEVYALEIQLCTATKNSARMKEIYPKTLKLDAAIADPRIMGVIREEGGKLYMSEERWKEAYDEFFEGFRNYQEAGNTRAKDCLKYVVLANMLALSDINPFDSREAKVYQEEQEIKAMVDLRAAYENNDIVRFERLLRDKRNRILDDAFIMTYVEPLLRNIRAQVLMELVKPYQRIQMDFISKEINISKPEVESLLVELILDHRIVGKIDQTNDFLLLSDTKNSVSAMKYEALGKWTDTLASLTKAVHNRAI
jgi:COP9 signalosome complex subunit 2